ncbi:hypothetical protein D5018_19245 [Parashewanella curva]|uniref:Ankyrin repeat domain-containing protein n=1 Tax=Parashewanella curva TaxID=2338552 RepID=A0A3L8PRM0_9GAMM|nr:hypothetical protein [Parashewanella curva]RLV58057.1 hypothetical protein D5018_19245 [Parashewanella curva]
MIPINPAFCPFKAEESYHRTQSQPTYANEFQTTTEVKAFRALCERLGYFTYPEIEGFSPPGIHDLHSSDIDSLPHPLRDQLSHLDIGYHAVLFVQFANIMIHQQSTLDGGDVFFGSITQQIIALTQLLADPDIDEATRRLAIKKLPSPLMKTPVLGKSLFAYPSLCLLRAAKAKTTKELQSFISTQANIFCTRHEIDDVIKAQLQIALGISKAKNTSLRLSPTGAQALDSTLTAFWYELYFAATLTLAKPKNDKVKGIFDVFYLPPKTRSNIIVLSSRLHGSHQSTVHVTTHDFLTYSITNDGPEPDNLLLTDLVRLQLHQAHPILRLLIYKYCANNTNDCMDHLRFVSLFSESVPQHLAPIICECKRFLEKKRNYQVIRRWIKHEANFQQLTLAFPHLPTKLQAKCLVQQHKLQPIGYDARICRSHVATYLPDWMLSEQHLTTLQFFFLFNQACKNELYGLLDKLLSTERFLSCYQEYFLRSSKAGTRVTDPILLACEHNKVRVLEKIFTHYQSNDDKEALLVKTTGSPYRTAVMAGSLESLIFLFNTYNVNLQNNISVNLKQLISFPLAARAIKYNQPHILEYLLSLPFTDLIPSASVNQHTLKQFCLNYTGPQQQQMLDIIAKAEQSPTHNKDAISYWLMQASERKISNIGIYARNQLLLHAVSANNITAMEAILDFNPSHQVLAEALFNLITHEAQPLLRVF